MKTQAVKHWDEMSEHERAVWCAQFCGDSMVKFDSRLERDYQVLQRVKAWKSEDAAKHKRFWEVFAETMGRREFPDFLDADWSDGASLMLFEAYRPMDIARAAWVVSEQKGGES